MARARRSRHPFWMVPLMVARTLRERSNCIQIAIESGDLDLPTAETLLRALRLRRAVQRQIDQIGKLPGTPKSFRLYQVPANYLFLGGCYRNVTQITENTTEEG